MGALNLNMNLDISNQCKMMTIGVTLFGSLLHSGSVAEVCNSLVWIEQEFEQEFYSMFQ